MKRKQAMEDTREQTRGYWCNMCNQMVDPIMEVEIIKCPLCLGGFVEEMDNPPAAIASHNHYPTNFQRGGLNSDRSLSLWDPVLLGMMSNPRRCDRLRRLGSAEEEDDDQIQEDQSNNILHHHHHHHHHHHLDHGEEEIVLNRELESIVRRRRRSSATLLQLLQGIRAGMLSASEGNAQSDVSNRDRSNNRVRDCVILINPFNQTIIVQSSYGVNNNAFGNQNQNPMGSLGDYLIGPGLDLLLQHLAENDPNRHGTPPAQKDAVEAMPTVKVEENLQCSICLEDFDIGAEAKEMACKHKFHTTCILPWLEMHSSCPVCRHQLPIAESKLHSSISRSNSTGESSNGNNRSRGVGERNMDEDGRRLSVAIPWRLSSMFSFLGSAAANANTFSAISSADSSTNPFGSSTRTDENGV